MRWFGLFHVKPSCSKRVLQPYQRGLTLGERSPSVLGGSAYACQPQSAVSRHPHLVERPEWCPVGTLRSPSSTGLSTGRRYARSGATACASRVEVGTDPIDPRRARRMCVDNHGGGPCAIRQRSASFRGSSRPSGPLRVRDVRALAPARVGHSVVVRGLGPASLREITNFYGCARELSTELSTGVTSAHVYG